MQILLPKVYVLSIPIIQRLEVKNELGIQKQTELSFVQSNDYR